jgi:hypothetical protein
MAADAEIFAKFVTCHRLRGLESGDHNIDLGCSQSFAAYGHMHSSIKVKSRPDRDSQKHTIAFLRKENGIFASEWSLYHARWLGPTPSGILLKRSFDENGRSLQMPKIEWCLISFWGQSSNTFQLEDTGVRRFTGRYRSPGDGWSAFWEPWTRNLLPYLMFREWEYNSLATTATRDRFCIMHQI